MRVRTGQNGRCRCGLVALWSPFSGNLLGRLLKGEMRADATPLRHPRAHRPRSDLAHALKTPQRRAPHCEVLRMSTCCAQRRPLPAFQARQSARSAHETAARGDAAAAHRIRLGQATPNGRNAGTGALSRGIVWCTGAVAAQGGRVMPTPFLPPQGPRTADPPSSPRRRPARACFTPFG